MHLKPLIRAAAALALAAAGTAGALAADADNGKTLFKKCMACHRIGEGAANLVGPVLTGVVGRKAGTFEGYSYSATLKSAGEQGLVWDEAAIAAYLSNPGDFVKKYLTDKGKPELITDEPKMKFKLTKADGTPDPDSIADVIAYLKTFSK